MRDQTWQRCQVPRGRPGGRQMPNPRAVIKFQMPHPGIDTWANTRLMPGGGMGTAGIDWCIKTHEVQYQCAYSPHCSPYISFAAVGTKWENLLIDLYAWSSSDMDSKEKEDVTLVTGHAWITFRELKYLNCKITD